MYFSDLELVFIGNKLKFMVNGYKSSIPSFVRISKNKCEIYPNKKPKLIDKNTSLNSVKKTKNNKTYWSKQTHKILWVKPLCLNLSPKYLCILGNSLLIKDLFMSISGAKEPK